MTNEEPEEKTPEIWIPLEKIDVNTQRMAWLLFLEEWKKGLLDDHRDLVTDAVVENTYKGCLQAAKIVRGLEQGGG